MKKIILFIALAFYFVGYGQIKLKGVVTYYFNEYQGDKPDVGAKIIAIDSSTVKKFDYDLCFNFSIGSGYQKTYSNYQFLYEQNNKMYEETLGKKRKIEENEKYKKDRDEAKIKMDEIYKELQKYNSETIEKFTKEVDVKLYMQFLTLDDDLPSSTVDSSGSYSIILKPGTYYIYIKSKGRSGNTLTEKNGKVYVKKIKIKVDDLEKDVSYNFKL